MLRKAKKPYNLIFLIAGVAILIAGGLLFINHKKDEKQSEKIDPREINRIIDEPSLAYIKQLDKESNNAVFVFTKDFPEFKNLHNRVIILKPFNQDIRFNFDEYVHKDYMGGPIYILMPSYYEGIRAKVMLKCFPGYKGFSLKELSDNYVLFFAKDKR
ncbi:LPXTG cell wall anchor domain-containing protein [Mucilaginibacter segetis]|uniref:Gram-positive cocci surface proteins LPxTG domain-containing protein n=1 Tax=Mucilaginibacter segetis TaxID=2793071 RepID=A0A934PP85_9SPHI|nr:LPXTG cell wall anchor domain-containing protein [Mucilaginibacter segetis]MBK0378184.1 hypothetical protein [Mucilaginibacter segetis]